VSFFRSFLSWLHSSDGFANFSKPFESGLVLL
jgi:hypothetical protein